MNSSFSLLSGKYDRSVCFTIELYVTFKIAFFIDHVLHEILSPRSESSHIPRIFSPKLEDSVNSRTFLIILLNGKGNTSLKNPKTEWTDHHAASHLQYLWYFKLRGSSNLSLTFTIVSLPCIHDSVRLPFLKPLCVCCSISSIVQLLCFLFYFRSSSITSDRDICLPLLSPCLSFAPELFGSVILSSF